MLKQSLKPQVTDNNKNNKFNEFSLTIHKQSSCIPSERSVVRSGEPITRFPLCINYSMEGILQFIDYILMCLM